MSTTKPSWIPTNTIAEHHPRPASLGPLHAAPIVVAVGGANDAGPVRVAAALQHRHGSTVSAVQVLDTSELPLLTPLPAVFTLAREIVGDAPYAEDVRARRTQFEGWTGEPNDWAVHVAVGTPAGEILRYAQRQHAALIVMGLRHHGVTDRVLGDETTLTVARRARALVLGVVSSVDTLPRRAVVGVDFGPASIRAARAALDVLARPTTNDATVLHLVYVDRYGRTDEVADEATAGAALIERLGVAAAFDQLIHELEAPDRVTIECAVRHGDPAAELLAVADETGSDLIALGSLRHERVERWVLGSVTTEVVRDGRCSVLVVPPVAHPE